MAIVIYGYVYQFVILPILVKILQDFVYRDVHLIYHSLNLSFMFVLLAVLHYQLVISKIMSAINVFNHFNAKLIVMLKM